MLEAAPYLVVSYTIIQSNHSVHPRRRIHDGSCLWMRGGTVVGHSPTTTLIELAPTHRDTRGIHQIAVEDLPFVLVSRKSGGGIGQSQMGFRKTCSCIASLAFVRAFVERRASRGETTIVIQVVIAPTTACCT